MSGAIARQAAGRPAARDVFQWLSYLQYPAMLVALGYVFKSGLALASTRTAKGSPSSSVRAR